MTKKLYWSAQGVEKTLKNFKSIEGTAIKIEGLDYETFYYKSEIDKYYYIVLVNCGVSISNGKTLKGAKHYLTTLIEKQGAEKINDKIKENLESGYFQLTPETQPAGINQLLTTY